MTPAPSRGAQFLEELANHPDWPVAPVAPVAPPADKPVTAGPGRKRALAPSAPLPVVVPEPSREADGGVPEAVDSGVDGAPLHLRLYMLQGLRIALAVLIAVTAFVLPGPVGKHLGPLLAAVSVAYAVISTSLEAARGRMALRSASLLGGLVLFDGVYLAVVMALTGGPQSVLSFLILVHVIAVTLLLSLRNGLKAALWHALLLFLTSWLVQAGVVDARPGASSEQSAVLGALALLVVAGATAGFSVLNEGEVRRGRAELRALANMSGRMAGGRNRTELVQALLEGVGEAFGHPRAAVVVADYERRVATTFALGRHGSLEIVATGSVGDAVVRHSLGIVEGAAATAPLLERALDPDRDHLLVAALPGATNVMVAPLVVEGRAIGALAVERGGGRRTKVTARTVDLIGQFAANAALALRSAELQAEVERMACTDGLTGLANRRSFEGALARELAQAVRRSEPCALIVLDVDHFKAVNDTHGHQTGDEVLEQVGWALGGAARSADFVARYGGEEFAVILPVCDGDEAILVAERLRAAVAQQHGSVAVTLSAGVAVFPADGSDASSLVAAADNALYKAKRQGRDRSVRFRRPRPVPTAS